MLNVVCVNHGDYLDRGDEYVRRLRAGVALNLRTPHRFHVLTEEHAPDAQGWWAKLHLFEPGRFEGRCLFFDLDTIICGPLDDIAAYAGEFAMLTDFYRQYDKASGVMAWRAEAGFAIWEQWLAAGKPQTHRHGDGGVIAEAKPDADRLQQIYPGQIVSFKAHCVAGIPDNARVIAFHGLPRPHMIHELMAHW